VPRFPHPHFVYFLLHIFPRSKTGGLRIEMQIKMQLYFVSTRAFQGLLLWRWRDIAADSCFNCTTKDSIFHDADSGILFASFKYVGYDWEGDMQKMRENEKVREWWRMTDGYQESLVPGAVSSEAGEPGWWKGLEEMFYCA
jgi:L-rhamnose mutarotase